MPAGLELPPPIRVETVLGALDVAARRSAREAGELVAGGVRRGMPARLASAQRSTVRRTATGYRIDVEPTSRVRYPGGVTARQVTRFREGGTGVYGPSGRPIRARSGHPFRLPHGWSGEVRGQPARHMYAQAITSTEALVGRVLELGAEAGARHAEAALSRGT